MYVHVFVCVCVLYVYVFVCVSGVLWSGAALQQLAAGLGGSHVQVPAT